MPWIGDWPIIGKLLSSFKTERITTEVILTITPRIAQPALSTGFSHHAFWSGTEFNYATSPVFSNPSRKASALVGREYGRIPAYGGARMKDAGQTNMVRSLTQLATPDPLLVIKPENRLFNQVKS